MIKVLHTYDLEPITVLDMPMPLLEKLRKSNSVWVPVAGNDKIEMLRIFRTEHEQGEIYWTPNEALALGLNPEWLPGQIQKVQMLEKKK